MVHRLILFFALLIFAQFSPASVSALEGRFQADGMDLVLKLSDGRVLRGQTLTGMRLFLGTGADEREIRIDDIALETRLRGLPLTFYRMSVKDRETGAFKELCQVDPDGERAAIAYPNGADDFSLTCTSGAEGKCILFGYFPWQTQDGIPMRDLHRACVHMLRADYTGDDRPTAKNGTKINIIDRFGIQNPGHVSWMEFEAAWGTEGAICVAHPRIADNITLDELADRAPRLKGRLGPHKCYEEAVRDDPRALIYNESVLTWRTKR
ncbi:ADYC domain-containing protein [Microvirga terricola]|uniref:ADYC domain-containing protein n=1 Tax=Microvirga terricola TaxID=2719797 RepID=A0ABX0VF12_9HYPH|nr:ADYC domain-containing protein [Microvirga terricola]NIX76936.1 hypothetical protein [Microvirga terricola]